MALRTEAEAIAIEGATLKIAALVEEQRLLARATTQPNVPAAAVPVR